MAVTTFTVSAYSFRTLPTPLDSQDIRTYNCIVPVSEIPEAFTDWLGVNARESSLTGRVPKAIRLTLDEQPEQFVAFNRGLAILASTVSYDNQTHKVTMAFHDKASHGVFDGGHTLTVILDQRSDQVNGNGNNDEQAYCRVEIMTGVPVDMITDIVEARNTSRQVASKSLMNLGGRFDELKKALGASVAGLVSWRENEEGSVDVREVLALLTALDATHYDEVKHPIQAYSGKEACLKHFEASPECYRKLYPVAKDILRMWDEIQAVVPDQYEGRYGGLKGCSPLRKPRNLPIIGGTTKYPFPSGYLYPIVAAFRSMLVETDGTYSWDKGLDPSKLVRDGLATRIFSGPIVNSIKDYHNPNKTGKDANVWGLAYQIAENFHLRQ